MMRCIEDGLFCVHYDHKYLAHLQFWILFLLIIRCLIHITFFMLTFL